MGSETRTIRLSGGMVTLVVEVDWFRISRDERDWLVAVVDKFNERADVTASEVGSASGSVGTVVPA